MVIDCEGLLDAGVDVLADAAAHLHLGQALALDGEGELESLADVEGREQLGLLLERDVGRVAGRVGEGAGLGDRANECRDAPVVAAQLEELLHDGAVLTLELADAVVPHVLRVGSLLDLDAQLALGIGMGGARDATVETGQGDRPAAAGQPYAIGYLGDGADASVLALVHRNEDHALLVARVDGQRHGHVREDDDVFERDEQKWSQSLVTPYQVFCAIYQDCTMENDIRGPLFPAQRPRAVGATAG